MHFLKITRGFSLIEMLLVLSLITMMLSLSWPSFTHLLGYTHSQTQLQQLTDALQFASQQAIQRRVTITMCKSNDQKSCSGRWQDGFIVFADPRQEAIVRDAAQILQSVVFLGQKGTLYCRAYPAHKDYFQFLVNGSTHHENGTFWHCPGSNQPPSWAVIISQSGRFRVIERESISNEKMPALSC